MSALSPILRGLAGSQVAFWCPGCDEPHAITAPGGWTWDGNVDAPTFSPSILVTGGHYAPDHEGDCWCTYNAKHPEDPSSFKCSRCHSFVRAGRIEFLSDCTHALAGKTVPLPPWPDPETTPGEAKESDRE